MDSNALLNDPLLTRADVLRAITLGATKFKELVRAGQFPPPVQITPHRVAWRSSSVQAFIDALPVADAYQDVRSDSNTGQSEQAAGSLSLGRLKHNAKLSATSTSEESARGLSTA